MPIPTALHTYSPFMSRPLGHYQSKKFDFGQIECAVFVRKMLCSHFKYSSLFSFPLAAILCITYKGNLYVCAMLDGYCIFPNSFLCLSPVMTLHNNYFVPTTVKDTGRKWIPLKLTHRLSAHVFHSHHGFRCLQHFRKQYTTSAGGHVRASRQFTEFTQHNLSTYEPWVKSRKVSLTQIDRGNKKKNQTYIDLYDTEDRIQCLYMAQETS